MLHLRIKIEPTKGIPTRFLGPTALPESLADMLINQVDYFEEKIMDFVLDFIFRLIDLKIRRTHHHSIPYHKMRLKCTMLDEADNHMVFLFSNFQKNESFLLNE
jgi:hypothetical protein